MKHERTIRIWLAGIVAIAGASAAVAQHDGDIAIGATADGQLRTKAFDPSHPCFDVETGVGLLTYFESANSYRTVDPGFDANFDADPEADFFELESGAQIWLVAAADLPGAFAVAYGGSVIELAGDDIPLGSAALHRHVRFQVDGNDPDFDADRLIWSGEFYLEDRGSTGYFASDVFTLRFSVVECLRGDVNGDGEVTFADINPFVGVLGSGGTLEERCSADCNADGVVDFADINAFVALLSA